MKRKLLAVGVSTLALAFGANSALATNSAPPGSSASQSNATSQILPVAVSAPITVPVNASVPVAVLGSNGDTTQTNDTDVDGSASNNETEQVIVQGGSGSKHTADYSNGRCSASTHKGANGDTTQTNTTTVDGSATNNETRQVILQGAGGSASQSNATSQILPVAVALPITAPVNASVPVAIGLPGLPALPGLPLVGGLLEVVGGVLADPVGTVGAVVADPLGAVTGTLGAIGLPGLPALPELPLA